MQYFTKQEGLDFMIRYWPRAYKAPFKADGVSVNDKVSARFEQRYTDSNKNGDGCITKANASPFRPAHIDTLFKQCRIQPPKK